MLRGKLTVLRSLELEDLDILQKWYLDQEVMYRASGWIRKSKK
ncbi:hypothetical protein [Anoxybacter fermentans]|nr:hypothetical protein [Anoxybacter fermentans]